MPHNLQLNPAELDDETPESTEFLKHTEAVLQRTGIRHQFALVAYIKVQESGQQVWSNKPLPPQLQQEIQEAVQNSTRPDDVVCNLVPDTVVVGQRVSESQILRNVVSLHTAVNRLSWLHSQQSPQLNVYTGISSFPVDGNNIRSLIKRARIAAGTAIERSQGRSSLVQFFRPEMLLSCH